MKVSLQETVGRHYADFWNTRKRYRVCKGSRGSKKSKTTALNMIHRLFEYPESNGLCVRRYSNTLRDSVYAVGDIVNFHGGTHYYSSYPGAKGYSARAGQAKITIANGSGGAHPWHLIHTDSSSNVYGWVDDGTFD